MAFVKTEPENVKSAACRQTGECLIIKSSTCIQYNFKQTCVFVIISNLGCGVIDTEVSRLVVVSLKAPFNI